MRRASAGHKHRMRRAARACIVSAVAGLSLLAGPAMADDAGGSHPIDSAARMLGVKVDPGTPPDFVLATRPKTQKDFMPVGIQHPERPIKIKSPAELKASETELDAARIHQDKISGRKPPDDNPKPAKKPKAAASAPAAATPN